MLTPFRVNFFQDKTYPIIHNLKMVEERAETIAEYLNLQKRLGWWENPLALHVPSDKDI